MVTISAAARRLPWKHAKFWKETNDLGQYQYVVSRALFLMTSKAGKLPLETKPVARDNNTILTLKPGDQTFIAPYSTDNHNTEMWHLQSAD